MSLHDMRRPTYRMVCAGALAWMTAGALDGDRRWAESRFGELEAFILDFLMGGPRAGERVRGSGSRSEGWGCLNDPDRAAPLPGSRCTAQARSLCAAAPAVARHGQRCHW